MSSFRRTIIRSFSIAILLAMTWPSPLDAQRVTLFRVLLDIDGEQREYLPGGDNSFELAANASGSPRQLSGFISWRWDNSSPGQAVTISCLVSGAADFSNAVEIDNESHSANTTFFSISPSIRLPVVEQSPYTYHFRCGGSPGGHLSQTITIRQTLGAGAPVTPAITGISPNVRTAGDGGFALTITGQDFAEGATVVVEGAAVAVTSLSANRIVASIPASAIASAGRKSVVVRNPDGRTSNALSLLVEEAPAGPPVITGISPSAVDANSDAFPLTITGRNFTDASIVRLDGGDPLQIGSSSRAQLVATVPKSEIDFPRKIAVTVEVGPEPEDISNIVNLTVRKSFIRKLELLQVIEEDDVNKFPVFAKKPTLLRVFLDRDSSMKSLDVQATATSSRGASLTAFVLDEATDSMRVALPLAWTEAGAVSITVNAELKSGNGESAGESTQTASFMFEAATKVNVKYIPICVQLGGPETKKCPPLDKIGAASRFSAEIFPVGRDAIDYQALGGEMVWKKEIKGTARINELMTALRARYEAIDATERAGIDQLIGWLDSSVTFQRVAGGSVTNPAGVADAKWRTDPDSSGRVALVKYRPNAGKRSRSETTLAHEMAHNFGLKHVGAKDPGGSKNGDPNYWPYATAKIQRPGLFPANMKLLDPTKIYDLMSYQKKRWITPFHYKKLVDSRFAPQNLKEEPRLTKNQGSSTYWIVTGSVSRDGSVGEISSVFEIDSAKAAAPGSGGTCLEAVGAGGSSRECLTLSFEDPETGDVLECESFAVRIPALAGAQRLALVHDGHEVAALDASGSAPTVEIVSPTSGQTWEGPQEILWSAEDGDGDSLTYSVLYSPDAGSTWLPVDLNLTEQRVAFDASRFEGGEATRFRVIASDGLRSGMAEVGGVRMLQRPSIEVDSEVDLGIAAAGAATEGVVLVRNGGSGPLVVTSAEIGDAASGFEVLGPAFPAIAEAGSSLSVDVRYLPNSSGLRGTDLVLQSNAGSATVRIEARGAQAGGPSMQIVDDGVDFGQVAVGEFDLFDFEIANVGTAPLRVEASVRGDRPFQAIFYDDVLEIAPGTAVFVQLAAAPTESGVFQGTLVLSTNDPDRPSIEIPLVADAVVAELAPLPEINAGGVVNAASFSPKLAPGQIASVFGTNLSTRVQGADSIPLPREVDGARILIGKEGRSQDAPLFFISPNQANFAVPYGLAPGEYFVWPWNRRRLGFQEVVRIEAAAPGVFVNPSTGEPVVIKNSNGSLVTAANPVEQNDILIAYVTGLGEVDPAVATGAAPNGISGARLPVRVLIGDHEADVLFAGLTPGFVGLAQINMRANLPALPGAALSPEGAAVLTTLPLVITVDGVSSEPSDLPVDVPGGLPPQIDFEPVGLDFGEVGIGQTGRLTLTVFNRGGSDMIVAPVSATSAEFRALAPNGPQTLAPGGSQGIPVEFTPAEAGPRFGSLVIGSNDPHMPEIRVPLVGLGVSETSPGQLAISPGAVEFGSVQVGQSAVQDVSVGNTGGEAISLNGLTSSLPGEFSVQLTGAALPVDIPPGGMYPARIVFQPSAAGERSATLTASASASGVNVTLRGTGVAPPTPTSSLVVTRSELNFGGVSFGRTNELPLIIRNDGEAASTITGVSSTDPQVFLAAPSVPISVDTGQEALLRIHFSPAVAGLQQATLTVNTPGGPLPTTVAITGTGQQGPEILFSDSFERPDAAACALGVADNAFGGSGSHRYSAIAAGVRLAGGRLENVARDFGGVAFSTEPSACPGAASTTGQDLNIRATVFVPRSGERSTQAGPFFHAPKLTSGVTLHGGGKAGHWVQVDSSGTIYAIRLDTGQVVATSLPVPGFDASISHVIEVAVRGATAEVAIDGRLRVFTQGAGTGRSSISLVPTGALSQGGAGVGFSAYDGPGSAGGQTMDDIVVTEHESLAGLPVSR